MTANISMTPAVKEDLLVGTDRLEGLAHSSSASPTSGDVHCDGAESTRDSLGKGAGSGKPGGFAGRVERAMPRPGSPSAGLADDPQMDPIRKKQLLAAAVLPLAMDDISIKRVHEAVMSQYKPVERDETDLLFSKLMGSLSHAEGRSIQVENVTKDGE
ncbi:hypothetical protein B0H10DRAFT_1953353 [Mycena sp. CBHHK59/15]|nr:hypothetical protein B0H10DRAFT_1953353 [Mycena sp. CBHHK59/15]